MGWPLPSCLVILRAANSRNRPFRRSCQTQCGQVKCGKNRCPCPILILSTGLASCPARLVPRNKLTRIKRKRYEKTPRPLALAALLCLSSPLDAFAQAASPQLQFSITGFIDTVATWTQHFSSNDLNFNLNRDRGRFDIIGQVGVTKGVFGFALACVQSSS